MLLLQVPMVSSIYMGGKVMTARKDCDVQYPNLYAVPGFHKRADEFNRCQRGHQAFFEMYPFACLFGLIGGIKHPVAATISGLLFSVGSICYQTGYADTSLDVKMARYKKGGGLKWVGFFLSLAVCISEVGSMNGWWGKQ